MKKAIVILAVVLSAITASAQLRQMLTDMSLTTPTIGIPSLGSYIDKVKALKSPHTQRSYESTLARLKPYCDAYKVRLSDMSYAWFEGFVNSMEADGRGFLCFIKFHIATPCEPIN